MHAPQDISDLKAILSPLISRALPSLLSGAQRRLKAQNTPSILQQIENAVWARIVQSHPAGRLSEILLGAGVDAASIDAFTKRADLESLCRTAITLGPSAPTQKSELLEQSRTVLRAAFPSVTIPVLDASARELAELVEISSIATWDYVRTEELGASLEKIAAGAGRMLAEDLKQLMSRLAARKDYSQAEINAFQTFLPSYLHAVRKRHGRITPPNSSQSEILELDRLYVVPDFEMLPSGYEKLSAGPERDRKEYSVDRDSLLASTYRSVILGTAGAGKSTFLKKILSDISTVPPRCLIANRDLIPVMITLKDYAWERRERQFSIVDFVQSQAKIDLQLDDIPKDFFLYLLHIKRALILFDGLDELTEVAERVAIRDAVEAFCDNYPGTPVIVTSRLVGYEQAPLTEAFKVYRVLPFSEAQTSEYLQKWFSLHLNPIETESRTRSFMRDSSNIKDLRSNPLLLALMCNLYRQDGYLPKNRPSVYRRCADLLFEKWDTQRNIYSGLPSEHLLRPVMTDLAYWFYSEGLQQRGAPESKLIERTSTFLQKHFESMEEAEFTARKFVEFCRGRAWVFTDTGSDRDQRLYQFTHRTFLELFTGEYLVRNYTSISDLFDHLLPSLLSRESDMVLQLAFQIKASDTEGGTDELFNLFITKAEAEKNRRFHCGALLSFACRALDFLYPTPPLRRKLVKLTINALCRYLRNAREFGYHEESQTERLLSEAFVALLEVAPENRAVVEDALFSEIVQKMRSANTSSAVVAARLTMSMRWMPELVVANKESADGVRRLREKIESETRTERQKIAPLSLELSIDSWRNGIGTVQGIIHRHGLKSLLATVHDLFSTSWYSPLAEMIVSSAIESEAQSVSQDWVERSVVDAGEALLSTFPWPILRAVRFAPSWQELSFNATVKLPKDPEIRGSLVLLILFAYRQFQAQAAIAEEGKLLLEAISHISANNVHSGISLLREIGVPEPYLDAAIRNIPSLVQGQHDM